VLAPGAERDEDRGEAGDEGEGGDQQRQTDGRRRYGRTAALARLAAKLIDRHAGHVAEIRRHERQHAGRQEGNRARAERADIGNVDSHEFSGRCPSSPAHGGDCAVIGHMRFTVKSPIRAGGELPRFFNHYRPECG
jgi:hypothetical protein